MTGQGQMDSINAGAVLVEIAAQGECKTPAGPFNGPAALGKLLGPASEVGKAHRLVDDTSKPSSWPLPSKATAVCWAWWGRVPIMTMITPRMSVTGSS